MKLSDRVRLLAEANTATGGSVEQPQTAIVYGPPKSGKTTLAAQLAKRYNVHWLDIEKGSQTLFTAVPPEYMDNFHLYIIPDEQNTPTAIRLVTKILGTRGTTRFCELHGNTVCPECTKLGTKATWHSINPREFSTKDVLVIDSFTQLSDSAMAHVLGPLSDFEKKQIEFSHYDRQGLALKNILGLIKQLPCHVVVISHEEELEQEDGTKKLSPCGGTRNFARRLSRYFDHVVYVQIKNKKHVAVSGTTSELKIQAGSRNHVELEKGESIENIFSAKVDVGKVSRTAFTSIEDAESAGEAK